MNTTSSPFFFARHDRSVTGAQIRQQHPDPIRARIPGVFLLRAQVIDPARRDPRVGRDLHNWQIAGEQQAFQFSNVGVFVHVRL